MKFWQLPRTVFLGAILSALAASAWTSASAAEPGASAAEPVGTAAEPVAAAIAQAPSPVGRQVEAFTLEDYRGKAWSLADFAESKAVVVAYVGVECPLVQHYASRLQAMADKYAAAGVAF